MKEALSWKRLEEDLRTQNLETELGLMTLEELGQSDRGTHHFTTMLALGEHNGFLNLIPAYFFGEEIAKAEIELWLEAAEKFIQHTQIGSLNLHLRAEYLLHGKHCMVTRGMFFLNSKSYGYFFNVITGRELNFVLTVDEGDCFPRFFMQEEVAINNAETWLMRVHQKAEFSAWKKI